MASSFKEPQWNETELAWELTVKDSKDKELLTCGSPLYISFEIKRDITKIPNSANISVYNLKDETRRLMQKYTPLDSYNFDVAYTLGTVKNYDLKNYRSIILKVKRNNKESVIFAGTVTECTSQRSGADWVTEFQCSDGLFASRFSVMDTTVEANYIAITEIEREAKQWKMSVDIQGTPHLSNKPITFLNLNEMLEFSFPNNWFVDNETLKCFGKGAQTDKDKKVFILGGNQIINSPKRTNNTLNIDTIFFPELKLGQVVDIRSLYARDYNAQWEIASVSHSGELGIGSGNSCNTSLLCFPPNTRFGSL